jgi:hypothetical protein
MRKNKKDTHQAELQLSPKYTAFVLFDIQLGSSIESTEFDITEKYEDVTMVDNETDETFKLKQLLPPLRHELEYILKNKIDAYVYTNFMDMLVELADDEWLTIQDRKAASDSGAYKH